MGRGRKFTSLKVPTQYLLVFLVCLEAMCIFGKWRMSDTRKGNAWIWKGQEVDSLEGCIMTKFLWRWGVRVGVENLKSASGRLREKDLTSSKLYMTTHFLSQRNHRAHCKKRANSVWRTNRYLFGISFKTLEHNLRAKYRTSVITAWSMYIIIMELSSINVMISVAVL